MTYLLSYRASRDASTVRPRFRVPVGPNSGRRARPTLPNRFAAGFGRALHVTGRGRPEPRGSADKAPRRGSDPAAVPEHLGCSSWAVGAGGGARRAVGGGGNEGPVGHGILTDFGMVLAWGVLDRVPRRS